MQTLWVLGFSPPSEIPCYSSVHTYTPVWQCGGLQPVLWHLGGSFTTVAPCSNCHSGPSRILLARSLTPLLTCLNRPLNEWPPFLYQSLCSANNSALGIIQHNHHGMCCDLLCQALHLLSLPITCLAFPHPCSHSCLTWPIAPSHNCVMFPGPVCVWRHIIIAIL